MQHCHYKNTCVIPEVVSKGPRDHYAKFCIETGRLKKRTCYTVRPNFKTSSEAREAAYKAGRAKVDSLVKESTWGGITDKLKSVFSTEKIKERRSANTVYYMKS